eukprot:Selendium_serpulae@DN3449_c1_g1_i11.p1
MDASGYKDTTQSTLVKRIRDADLITAQSKAHYGNGVSVKGIISNVSGHHYLSMNEKKSESGKSWDDAAVLPPSNSVGPLEASAFFHAKADGAATGCRGGMTYKILDKDSVIQGFVATAWQQPYQGDFRYCIWVSKTQDLLQTCLNYVNDNCWSASRRTTWCARCSTSRHLK